MTTSPLTATPEGVTRGRAARYALPPVTRGPGRADLAAIGALAGYLAVLPLPSAVRALLLVAFMALGPGGAVLTWVDIPARARPAAFPVLGMSITTLTTVAAMWSRHWNPTVILVVGAVVVSASSILWYSTHSWPRPALIRRLRRASANLHWHSVVRQPAVLMTVLALLIWGASLPWLPGVDAGTMGLLFSGSGPLLAVAITVCTTAFLIAVRRGQLLAAAGALVAAIAISRLTTTLATEMPLYDWTYKHIAVVDYILTHGLIQPDATDIYAQWPAFFVVAAWFCDVSGLSPITLAHVFAPAVHVLIAVTVFAAARVLRYSRRTALTACYVVEIVNWVGQDYFSPQAWTLVLAYGLLVLLLASPTSRSAAVVALIPFAAMVPSHQLTPFWLILTAALLVITRRARPWWVVVVMVAIAGGYLLLHFDAVAPYGILSGGSPVSNATSNVAAAGTVEKQLTSTICRGLSVVVLVTAVACAVWQRRRRQPALAASLLAFSPLALLLGQNYGGEAIFRVFLYGLLGCGLLTAPAIVNAVKGFRAATHPRLGVFAAWCWMTACAVAGLHAYVALWPMVVETRAQVDYMDTLTAAAEPGTRLMSVQTGGMPTRVNEHYAQMTLQDPYFDLPLNQDGAGDKATFPTAEQLGALQWAIETSDFPTYVVFSEQSRKAVEYYDEYPPDAIPKFQQFLSTTPGWTEVHRDGETVVFFHPGAATQDEVRAEPGRSALTGTTWGGSAG